MTTNVLVIHGSEQRIEFGFNLEREVERNTDDTTIQREKPLDMTKITLHIYAYMTNQKGCPKGKMLCHASRSCNRQTDAFLFKKVVQ